MATSPNYCNTYEYNCKVNRHLENSDSSRVTWETHDMEVRGHLISAPDLLVSQDSKQRAERMTALQERRRSLQTLLNTRVSELKRVCLQEAELTGEVPNEFPLESGERPPYVRRRVGTSRHGAKNILKAEEDEAPHRKPKKTLFSSALRRHTESEQQKTLFSSALRRHTESEQHQAHGKRTVHRGCHTDDTVRSESSSMSDSTGHDTDDWSESQPADPDCRLGRKLSPVEVYYEMRTRRNSLASSVSPSRSLPRSVSNLEGRSVPATPLLARTNQGVNIRSDFPGGPVALKLHWSDNHQAQPHTQPLPNQDGHLQEPSDQGHGNASTGRSNSSEALLDRNTSEEDGGPGVGVQVQRPAMPPRSGPPYKSSEALMEGRLRQVQRGSPERQVNGHGEPHRMRTSVGGRGGGAGGYNEILMDYVWGKQQKIQNQQLQRQQSQGNNQGKARLTASVSTNFNGYPQPPPPLPPQPHSQPQYPSSQPQGLHLSGAPPAYSPLMLRGKPGEPRRVKVTRTKSCGPFIPLQQDGLLLSAYPDPITNSYPHPHPQPDQPSSAPPQLGRGPPQYPSEAATPEDATRSLHKALALEGLRDWYLRNTLGHPGSGGQGPGTGPGSGKGQENGAPHRRRTTASLHCSSQPHTLQHQQSYQGEGHLPYPTQNPTPHLPHSATFHGHPLHGRSVELPLYQDILPTQLQELSLKGANGDQPSPGTLV
ncbi:coiled-coil domain-containing protein 120 isoform X2 [Hypomesus transpacificus]|uniref:coiled-coil domain-containing protein 120 isoform X2 n=1 Tax=Hypomesus transpacificus TaxID=137520 RepID=UPI001F08640D|nr:coiled-coil domain-containing protein 120 isoform X2 [Hypomesus transpacificus]